MAEYTLDQIKAWNPNWSGRYTADPGAEFNIVTSNGKYWNFKKNNATGNYVATGPADKPSKAPKHLTGAQLVAEIWAGTYGNDADRAAALEGHPEAGTIQQVVNQGEPVGGGGGTEQAAAAADTEQKEDKSAVEGKQAADAGKSDAPAAPAATAPAATAPAATAPAATAPAATAPAATAPQSQTQTPPTFDPANPRLQQYIQRIVYGNNLQGVYSRGNVDKAYMGLIQRGYTPEQAHQTLEAFHSTMQRRPGFGVIDSGLAKARAMREDMYTGWRNNENTARQLRQDALSQQPPSPTLQANAAGTDHSYETNSIPTRQTALQVNAAGTDHSYETNSIPTRQTALQAERNANRQGVTGQDAVPPAPADPTRQTALQAERNANRQGVTGQDAVPPAPADPTRQTALQAERNANRQGVIGQDAVPPAPADPTNTGGPVPADAGGSGPDGIARPGATAGTEEQQIQLLQQMSSGVPGLEVLSPADPASGTFKVMINGNEGVGYLFGTKPYFVTGGPNGIQVQDSSGTLLNHSGSPGAQNGGAVAPLELERVLASKGISSFYKGGYVTRPKKSVLKAIRQWRHGT